MDSFIDKLRMNNLYPSAGLGPPDFNATSGPSLRDALYTIYPLISEEKEKNRRFQREMLGIQQQGRLKEIAAQVAPQQNQPQNVVYQGMSPYEQATLDFKNRELEQKTGLGKEKLSQAETLGQGRLDIQNKRASVYKFKAENPGLKFMQGKDGRLRALNPISGEVTDLGETGLSDEEIINLNQQNALEQIGARGDVQTGIQNLKGQQNLAGIAARIAGQIPTEKPELPTQNRVRITNAARRLINEQPKLGKYLEQQEDGSFRNTAPPDSREFQIINNALYPKGNVNLPNESKSIKMGPPEDEKVVVEKDGQKFHLPKTQLDEAIKQGYKQVVGGG